MKKGTLRREVEHKGYAPPPNPGQPSARRAVSPAARFEHEEEEQQPSAHSNCHQHRARGARGQP
eukprot:10960901-Prorocentrum_lima.AAC.1